MARAGQTQNINTLSEGGVKPHSCYGLALFSARKQNIGAEEYPERIVGDERDLDEYAN